MWLAENLDWDTGRARQAEIHPFSCNS